MPVLHRLSDNQGSGGVAVKNALPAGLLTYFCRYSNQIKRMIRHRWWNHIGIWAGLYIFWITIFQNHALTFSRTLTVEFCYLLFIAANYYFHVYFTIPRLLYRKKYFLFGCGLLGGIAVGAFLRTLLSLWMSRHFFRPGGVQPGFSVVLLNSLLNISVWVTGILAAYLLIEKMRFRKYVDSIEKENTRNELNFLKAQFNPHFLFNSINSIYGHIDKNNPTARNMLLTFSEMLRYQLYECNTDSISIDKEIHYIRNYVALQQTRKEENLVVRLAIRDGVRGFAIAPMLFIAFIENAFKYVSNHDSEENKVEICLDRQEDWLLFRTFNTREKNNGGSIRHQGIGIANVRRRLELLYPGGYDLFLEEAECSYEVRLKIRLG
jgi:two-component system LytT family sensor kinase